MTDAGYTDAEAAAIKAEIAHYANVRDEVKLGAGEDIDFKQYEAGMRFLLDTYIQADAVRDGRRLRGHRPDRADRRRWAPARSTSCPRASRTDPEAVAETITNNMRKVIIDERAMNPKYYDKMSRAARRPRSRSAARGAIDYKEYLEKLIAHARKLGKSESDTDLPRLGPTTAPSARSSTSASRAEISRVEVDDTVRDTASPTDWIGNPIKEKKVRRALINVLPDGYDRLDELIDAGEGTR